DFKELIKDRGGARQKGLSATKRYEFKIISKDGQEKWVDLAGTTTMLGGSPAGLITIIDITARKLAEEETRRSLREKESLLAEIHHRVKNNMQIITSLLSLQSKEIKDERALSLIKNCEDRIRSMSLVHEKLYLSEDLSRIDFHDYMEDLSARLFQVHRVDSNAVGFSSHIKDVSFNIETAIPLGLIINEIISNAIKHAFPEGRKGNIAVELTQNTKAEEYTLTVTDDGIGFPEGTDYRNTETFGLQLVEMLTEQLNGTIKLDRSKGTSFKIVFKERKYKKRI
ncbi:MAG: histidine kinase dimerization/phosphoacceptor domain -containing protein, partial [Thermodesulfobacteriota bacterium]|nr:histidine kinase dimerization/phosphoacceptor domain -containing protein [Thermodesulfobacteriota bacterium]